MEVKLLNSDRKKYGEKYDDHIFDQYKIYLESAERMSDRRLQTNNYFITINSALIALGGILGNTKLIPLDDTSQIIFAVVGIIVCFVWYRMINSYKQINSAKFKVIHQIEQYLPLRLYEYEWEQLGSGKNKSLYQPFSHLEIHVPKIFAVIYILILIVKLCSF
jgi:hypothetical protein